MLFSFRWSHTGPTQEVTEWLIQHPQKQQELPKLSLHSLLTLLKVPMLQRAGGTCEGRVQTGYLRAVPDHSLCPILHLTTSSMKPQKHQKASTSF